MSFGSNRPVFVPGGEGGGIADIDQVIDDIQGRFILTTACSLIVTVAGHVVFDGNND